MSIEYEYKFFDRSTGKYGQGGIRTWMVTVSSVDPVVLVTERDTLIYSWSPEDDDEADALATVIRKSLNDEWRASDLKKQPEAA